MQPSARTPSVKSGVADAHAPLGLRAPVPTVTMVHKASSREGDDVVGAVVEGELDGAKDGASDEGALELGADVGACETKSAR